jgi:hypothetical protein
MGRDSDAGADRNCARLTGDRTGGPREFHSYRDKLATPSAGGFFGRSYAQGMEEIFSHNDPDRAAGEAGYTLRVSDRTTAAMQLAAHYTAESMRYSTTQEPRARLAEQLSYFDLAFRSIMSSTARAMIKSGSGSGELDSEGRIRSITGEFR